MSKRFTRTLLSLVTAAAFTSGSTFAKDHADDNPRLLPDGAFASVRGVAVDTGPSSFQLDYGEGTITVEMDDWDSFKEGKLLLDGDKVTVYGLIDNDFYHERRIEAEGVYVDDLQTGFTNMSATDEEDVRLHTYYTIPVDYDFVITGEVSKTDGREFFIDTGSREVKVDTLIMPYNPMDESGFQKIEVGDIVKVSGDLDIDLFEEREIMAESIISLSS